MIEKLTIHADNESFLAKWLVFLVFYVVLCRQRMSNLKPIREDEKTMDFDAGAVATNHVGARGILEAD